MRGKPIVLAVVMLGGCAAMHEDVSRSLPYAAAIGRDCKTQHELIVHGVARELPAKQTDYLVLMEPPGFDGPEVTFREKLPANTSLRVKAASRCTSCLPPRTDFIVSLEGKHATFDAKANEQYFNGANRAIGCAEQSDA